MLSIWLVFFDFFGCSFSQEAWASESLMPCPWHPQRQAICSCLPAFPCSSSSRSLHFFLSLGFHRWQCGAGHFRLLLLLSGASSTASIVVLSDALLAPSWSELSDVLWSNVDKCASNKPSNAARDLLSSKDVLALLTVTSTLCWGQTSLM